MVAAGAVKSMTTSKSSTDLLEAAATVTPSADARQLAGIGTDERALRTLGGGGQRQSVQSRARP